MDSMRLTDPIDFEILEAMSHGNREQARRLASNELEQYDREYVSKEMNKLASYGLLKKLSDSSMFEITELGHRAIQYRDLYDHQDAVIWGELVRGDLEPKDAMEKLLPDGVTLDDLDFDRVDES